MAYLFDMRRARQIMFSEVLRVADLQLAPSVALVDHRVGDNGYKSNIKYTMDILAGLLAGYTAAELAVERNCCERTVQRYAQQYRDEGHVRPRGERVRGDFSLRVISPKAYAVLMNLLAMFPNMTLHEISSQLFNLTGETMGESGLSRLLFKAGLTRKKSEFRCLQQSELDRELFGIEVSQYDPRRFVWIDEVQSHEGDALRTHGWAEKGEKVSLFAAKSRKGTYGPSLMSIAAVRCGEGLVYVDTHANQHVNALDFLSFLVSLRGHIRDDDILVMDNAPVHLRSDVDALGLDVIYLPRYSPHFNPIEFVFAATKTRYKTMQNTSFMSVDRATAVFHRCLEEAARHTTAYARHCGNNVKESEDIYYGFPNGGTPLLYPGMDGYEG